MRPAADWKQETRLSPPVFYTRRRWKRPLALAAVAAAVVAGVALAPSGDDRGRTPRSDGLPAEVDGPLQHVHGLGINPADGSLHLATHAGLFRVSGHGKAARVGASFQDLMGFTVVGPDEFIASGHPDVAGIRQGQPGQLGLIASEDGGGSWDLVSLTGRADFHALTFAHEQVYAINALDGRFQVSRDMKAWETRSVMPGTSIAVEPGDPDRVVVATASGVGESTDGGRSWNIRREPPLVLVAWDATLGLFGATAQGQILRRDAASGAWGSFGALGGEPEALVADGGRIYAAVQTPRGSTAVLTTSGGGWQKHFEADG